MKIQFLQFLVGVVIILECLVSPIAAAQSAEATSQEESEGKSLSEQEEPQGESASAENSEPAPDNLPESATSEPEQRGKTEERENVAVEKKEADSDSEVTAPSNTGASQKISEKTAPETLSTDEAETSEVDLDTVTVVGRDEFEVLRESGYPITVIDTSDFIGRAVTVSDLLERVPGVKVRRTGGAGSKTRISIRGLEGKRVQIYIQGQPLNAIAGTFTLDDIPIHTIERIEVYKGVVPARFGGDGLGGAINIVVTELPPNYVDASYGVETHGVHRVSSSAKTYFERTGIELGVSIHAQYAENDYDMPWSQGRRLLRDHDRYRQLWGELFFGFKKLYFDKLELELEYVANDKEIQGLPDNTSPDVDAPNRNVQHARTWSHIAAVVLQAAKERFIIDDIDLIYTFVVPFMYSGLVDKSENISTFEGERFPSPMGRGEIGIGANDSADKRLEVRQRLNLCYQLFEQFSLNLNNQLQYTYNSPEDELADAAAGGRITPLPGNMYAMTTGFSAELSIIDDRWLTVAGVKHHLFTNEGHATDVFAQDGQFLSPDATRHTYNGLGGNVASRFKVLDELMLRISYEHGQRMPTPDEVFGNGFNIKTSPGLRPEKSNNFIGGFLFEKTFGEGNDAIVVSLESDAFLMFVEDMIRLGGILTRNYENIDKVKIKGFDGALSASLTRYAYFYFGGTYQDIRNNTKYVLGTTQPNFLNGKRVPNTPPYFFTWGAEISFFDIFGSFAAPTQITLYYDGRYTAEFLYAYEVTIYDQRKVAACTSHDVGFQLSFKDRRYSLSASVSNIMDTQRYDEYNVPLPGQVVKAMLRGTFY